MYCYACPWKRLLRRRESIYALGFCEQNSGVTACPFTNLLHWLSRPTGRDAELISCRLWRSWDSHSCNQTSDRTLSMVASKQANGSPLALFLQSLVLPCGGLFRGGLDSLQERTGVITIPPSWRGQAGSSSFFTIPSHLRPCLSMLLLDPFPLYGWFPLLYKLPRSNPAAPKMETLVPSPCWPTPFYKPKEEEVLQATRYWNWAAS